VDPPDLGDAEPRARQHLPEPGHGVEPAGLRERSLKGSTDGVRHHADDEDVAQLLAARPALVHEVPGIEEAIHEDDGVIEELAEDDRSEVRLAAAVAQALDPSLLLPGARA